MLVCSLDSSIANWNSSKSRSSAREHEKHEAPLVCACMPVRLCMSPLACLVGDTSLAAQSST